LLSVAEIRRFTDVIFVLSQPRIKIQVQADKDAQIGGVSSEEVIETEISLEILFQDQSSTFTIFKI